MSTECDSSEITPLRSRNNYYNTNNNSNNNHHIINNIDCDNSDSINNNNNNNNNTTMDDTKRIIIKIVIDFLILCCVGIPILLFFILGEPYQRGFFCNDESLMHPFHESTVRNWMLYIIGLILPVGLILLTEIIQSNRNKHNSPTTKALRIRDWNIPVWLINAYKQIGVFGFGAACSQLTTDIAKYSIGRLRPHFHSVCQPVMPDGTNCSNPINMYRYIEVFTCIGEGSNARMLKEMRLSFPSGHASFSAYTMIYCAIYLQARMTWKGSKLIKHFLQFSMISLTWFTSLSRISDYKHHWSDVLAGATLGVICAMLISQFVSNLFVKKSEESTLPQNMPRYELSTASSNGGL